MNRLLVTLLAAFDALVVVAVGIAVVLAPLTLLWVSGLGAGADWTLLWPATVRIWQAGHFAPIDIALPDEYLLVTGIPAEAGAFTISLAPLVFAAFTSIFAARSGVRAARSGAWIAGVVSGTVTVAALAAVLAVTAPNEVATVDLLPAIALPTLVFAGAALVGAIVHAWREGDDGVIDALHGRLDAAPAWVDLPAAAARGIAVCLVGLIGLGALLVTLALAVRGGEVIALFEAAHVDLVGAIVLTLGQFAYLPTLVVWGAAFAAGPGFAIGTGTAVSPAGTNLGVVPGIPVLGGIPETTSFWMLLLALLVVGLGALAGAIARSALLIAPDRAEPVLPRVVALAAIAIGTALGAALLAVAASGAFGPGRLATVGPEPGPLALAVGIEVALGAGILLLAPRRSTPLEDDPAAWVRIPEGDPRTPVD